VSISEPLRLGEALKNNNCLLFVALKPKRCEH